MDREGKVDVSHNTRKQTLAYKAKVKKYIFFETYVKIYDNYFLVELASERMFGQEEIILNLYNVRVKRDPTAAHLSTLQTGVINNVSSDNKPVKFSAESQLTNKSNRTICTSIDSVIPI